MFNVGSAVAVLKADITNFKDGMNEAKSQANSLGTTLGGVSDGIMKFGKQAAIFTGIVGAGLIAIGKSSVDASIEAEAAQAKLQHAVIAVTKATQQELKATEDLATELQNKGVLDDDNIKTGLAQLSTFGLSNKAVRALGGSLADLAVNQFGVNASGEQLSDTANMIAKALNGQFGILEKSGIRFTDAQKKIIEFGTEMQKVDAINAGFAQNLKYTNEVALTGTEGKIAHLSVVFGNLKERLGEVIKGFATFILTGDLTGSSLRALGVDEDDPRIAGLFMLRDGLVALGEWIAANKDMVITALTGIGIALGTLLTIGTITILITALLNPLVMVGIAISTLYFAWQTNFWGIRDITIAVFNEMKMVWENILLPTITAIVTSVTAAWENISAVTTIVWPVIWGTIQVIWALIYGLISVGLALMTGDWKQAWENVLHASQIGWEGLKDIFWGVVGMVKTWGGEMLHWMVQPFVDAWNQIQELVRKIKDAMDPNKRHSPSMVDRVKAGVQDLNKAWGDLSVPMPTYTHAPEMNFAGASMSGGSGPISITIPMAGAFIGDELSAQRMSEVIGNNIIKKLQANIRF